MVLGFVAAAVQHLQKRKDAVCPLFLFLRWFHARTRQDEAELRPLTGIRFDPDFAAVALDDGFHDRQPQSRSFSLDNRRPL